MAALQQTPISFRSKFPPPIASASLTAPKNLSFALARRVPALRRSIGSSAGARMSASAAASYAVALADLAKSNDTLEATSADVEKIDKVFADPEVFSFFMNPTIEEEKKRNMVDELAGSLSLQPHMANFLNILIDSRRIELIKDVTTEFERVYNGITDTEMAVVSSVVQLESQHLAQIAKTVQKLTGAKNVRIKTVTDPSLVAGFTVRYGNSGSKLIDMSVKKQLEEIAAQLDLSDIPVNV
ncbi:ATP synthase delta chain, chloroplastic [Humulus lupulus]|uniref:ATP synthase delta chain, chloroplastic n=1 Tax=Humulus lupulus TaxID=3486 RepID=UPI002B411B37|nr:ATP synthase delta chain, chloroplastic [Humulus lupulus]